MVKMIGQGPLVILLLFMWCASVKAEPKRYVAIGDSYTIGTGVSIDERFPNQLVQALEDRNVSVRLVDNLARGGETSADLLTRQFPLLKEISPAPDVISVLIGTNDWVQGRTADAFRSSVEVLFSRLHEEFSGAEVFVLGSPDFASTPGGRPYAMRRDGSRGIQEFNRILCSIAQEYDYPCISVFSLSAECASDDSMLASDRLHPSGTQYKRWVTQMLPTVERVFKNP